MNNLKSTTVGDCTLIAINNDKKQVEIDKILNQVFDIRRIYYLYDNKFDEVRGKHAHKNLYQFIIGLNSGIDLEINDGESNRSFSLKNSTHGLLIPPGIWRTITNFKKDSVCLVFASEKYDENDYIRDYDEFKQYKLHS